MADREYDRAPLTLQVEFRTASSLLIAYSVNVSRGGLFLDTDADLPLGTEVTLALQVPGEPAIAVIGMVAWRRGNESPDGPPGLGVQFAQVSLTLGAAIDRLVSTFRGVTLLLFARDRQDRATLHRHLRSVVTSAEVLEAADAGSANQLLTPSVDLAVVHLDDNLDGGLALIRAARTVIPAVPTLALSSRDELRTQARVAGATHVCASPIAFAELQVHVLRALGRPSAVR